MSTDPPIQVEVASPADLTFLIAHRRHVTEAIIRRRVSQRQVVVARARDAIIGWLRFGLFWDAVPFMNMLFVLEAHRGKGVGRALVEFWERQMAEAGHEAVMTSTQSDEQAQHFYRRLGYQEIGGFVPPGEPLEIVFHKRLAGDLAPRRR